MTHRLRMSAELGDWLAELCTSEPASAAEVAAALVSVMDADDPSGLPAVTSPAAEPVDPREVVDDLYQTSQDALHQVRHQVAEASWKTAAARQLLSDLDNDGQPDPAVRAWLSQALTSARRHETDLAARCTRLQREVDAFRSAKETAKAMYTAAEASLRIHDAMETAKSEGSIGTETIVRYQPQPPPPAADGELTDLDRGLEAAEAKLHAVAEHAARTLREILDLAGPDAGQDEVRRSASAVADVLELRADPLERDVRLLFAVEPADAITVLAVLDGEGAITDQRHQAIQLAGDLLSDIRAGEWPPGDAHGAADLEVTFADTTTFLARFFPSEADAIARRAAALSLARSLPGLRADNGMSLADLAIQTGISQDRLRAIELQGLRVAHVHEAVACVRVLGGRLTLTAQIGESAPVELT